MTYPLRPGVLMRDQVILMMPRARFLSMPHLGLLAVVVFALLPVDPAAAQVRTDTRLEKDRYIVGEPIFVIVEVESIGAQPVAYDGSGNLSTPKRVELSVAGVARRRPITDAIASCLWQLLPLSGGGWAVDHPPVLDPGSRRAFKYALAGYDLEPGRYRLTAAGRVNLEWRESYAPIDPSTLPAGVPVPALKRFGDVVEGAAVNETFDLLVEAGSDGELRAAFGPIIADAGGPDPLKRIHARRTIMQLAPLFLEESIAQWTREAAALGDGLAWTGAEALARLGTASSRAILQQLVTTTPDDQLRLAVVRMLAAVASLDDLAFFGGLLKESPVTEPFRQAAALGLGRIGNDEAVGMLEKALQTAEPRLARSILTALGISRSRRALGVLIDHRYRATDDQLRVRIRSYSEGSDLCDALLMLTHLRFCRDGEADRTLLHQRLQRWASTSAASAVLYGNDVCVEEENLPFVE